jgi:hypothetical protein
VLHLGSFAIPSAANEVMTRKSLEPQLVLFCFSEYSRLMVHEDRVDYKNILANCSSHPFLLLASLATPATLTP